VPATGICFEITETAAIADLAAACAFMDELRRLGCRFVLDDFGSGLSSFTYLRTLPVQYLKIDGALVRHAAEDPIQREMVEAIHRVGVAMSALTIGESVESEEVLDVLRNCGVHFGQGYHLGRPRPLEEVLEDSLLSARSSGRTGSP
jgi:EAL domain-containing protein (putative c-di-GMP-specific phosphodiesterase class I)